MSAEPILIFPLLKKSKVKLPENIEETKVEDISKITTHLTNQINLQLKNHNFKMNQKMQQDIQFAGELLRSAMMRNVGKHHPLQDFIDEVIDGSEDEPETDQPEE